LIKSKRIRFGHWAKTDIDLAHELWGEPDVTKYISKTGLFSDEQIAERLKFEIASEKESGVQYWPFFEKTSGKFVGVAGLHPHGVGIYEIGFHLKPEFWGKGYAIEAAEKVIDYAFNELGAKELFAGHNPNNIASKKLLEKLGFEYTGDEFYEPTGLYHPSYKKTISG
jgi:RimJ/RimL family protein N-acetyltransferase